MSTLVKQLRTARATGVPIIAIATTDPAGTIETIHAAAKDGEAILLWDCINGLRGALSSRDNANTCALHAVAAPLELETAQVPMATMKAINCLTAVTHTPNHCWVIMTGASKELESHEATQAIWNLRDQFKINSRTLVLLAPSIQLRDELAQDVMVYDDPLPEDEKVKEIILNLHKENELAAPEEAKLARCITALRGLSRFATEQVAAFALTKSGIDEELLWERKKRTVEQDPAIRFHYGGDGFESVIGFESIKSLVRGLFANLKRKPGIVLFQDEFEKWAGGISVTGGDNGVNKDALAVSLRQLAEHNYPGITLVGSPGTGKTVIAHAIAAEFNVPCVEIDLGAAKGHLMGQSEARVREVWRIVNALAGPEGALYIVAANQLPNDIPEELLSRTAELGTYYVDLPSEAERKKIWQVQINRFDVSKTQAKELPKDTNWTGREIKAACNIASRLGCSLLEAARRVVPLVETAPEKIRNLRLQASGRWQNAHELGVYYYKNDVTESNEKPNATRQIELSR